jgi:hypothetical protein
MRDAMESLLFLLALIGWMLSGESDFETYCER